MRYLYCGGRIDPEDQEALDEGLCRTCLERAKDGMGCPERED
jgi:hypothetical protein